MIGTIRAYLQTVQSKTTRRKKIAVDELERAIMNVYGSADHYLQAGGYQTFYQGVKQLEQEGLIASIRSAPLNGRTPPLAASYWLMPQGSAARWSEVEMLRVADRLNMEKYRQQPSLQTDEEWGRIERVYRFLLRAYEREWVTREERSLELFGHEKWLAGSEGNAFLSRIGITLEDLKARVYGEPFVFWPRPGVEVAKARDVLIVENLSFFHTVKRVLESGREIAGIKPDLLVYGEGKKIESSFPFLFDLISGTDPRSVKVNYVGDIDAEGWGIYVRLVRRYPEMNVRLAFPLYSVMCAVSYRFVALPSYQDQSENEEVLQDIIRSFTENGLDSEARLIAELWRQRRRIPQEVLTFETFLDR